MNPVRHKVNLYFYLLFLNRAINLLFFQNDGLYLLYRLKRKIKLTSLKFCFSEKIYIEIDSKWQARMHSSHVFFLRG